jgi:class 3 adenylate cyclase
MSPTRDSTSAGLQHKIKDLQRQLAESTAERDEGLAREAAVAEVLGVINSSPGDLQPVFEVILEKAHVLCGAVHGVLVLRDGENFRAVGARGLPEAFAEQLKKGFPNAGNPVAQPLLDGAPFVQLPDVGQIDNPVSKAGAAVAGLRTLMAVPLRKDDALLGWIVAARREVRLFSEKQIALLQNFAAQAVIAMENARLITETREALEQQTATAEVLQVINASPGDLTPVFESILDKALRLCEAGSGALATWDGEYFNRVATRGPWTDPLQRQYLEPRRKPAPGSFAERIRHGENIISTSDLTQSDAFNSSPALQAAARYGMRSCVVVALRTETQLLGQISFFRREVRPFSEKEIALLQNFAAQAVIAMENARLLGELRHRTDEVAELNRGLEARVAEQVEELGRVGRLKRFLAPQLAELIVSQGDEKILESHRREIVVVFCDLRGYTAFTETAEPEDALNFMREYHGTLGPLVSQFEGTLDHFAGDGIMVFFNDPVPCPDPAERAVKMAMAMREAAAKLIDVWRRRLGSELGFGAGIAQGYATLGQIGFPDHSGYTATGTVCNLAARLCAEAKDGQILVSSRIAEAVEAVANLEDLGNLELKGLRRPVAAFNVVHSTSAADARPNLTVVARGPGPD